MSNCQRSGPCYSRMAADIICFNSWAKLGGAQYPSNINTQLPGPGPSVCYNPWIFNLSTFACQQDSMTFCFVFEIHSHCVALAGPNLKILLPQPPE